MNGGIPRRTFLEGVAAGAASLSLLAATKNTAAADAPPPPLPKVRVGKVYFGVEHPSWPMATVDVEAERQRFEKELARLQPALSDIEWIDCGLVTNDAELAQAKQKLQGADGILILQLTMRLGKVLDGLLELNIPTVLFAEPFCGHEWHTIAARQRQGKLVDCWATSRFDDLLQVVRPFRAVGRLKHAKVLYVNQADAEAKYVQAIREKFGTEIKSFKLADLEAAYQAVDEAAAQAEAQRWVREAVKVVEPSQDEILKAARMSLALQQMVRSEQAATITINCLGSGLIQRGMGYPCLGFCRLNSIGSGGICEADLKSAMTHLIFTYLVGRPGFVTDPCFDYSNNTIIHAHCVAAIKMLGPDGPTHPYIIRSHLEDNKGAVLQVQLPAGQQVSMARLIGNDVLLFSTGEAVDSPLVDRGCRSKLTVRVAHAEKFLEGWSSGLHRVVFYGDHTRDIERFCRFMQIRLVREGTDDVRDVPSLTWLPRVHA
jgi:hypothetical protein